VTILVAVVAVQLAAVIWTITRPIPAVIPDALAFHGLFTVFQVVALFSVFVLLWRTFLFRRYRATPGAPDDELPTITVIVPAYNEGSQVFTTIQSVMFSDYPVDKLSVIAIDDGSLDDTWSWIQRATTSFPDHVIALRCPMNRGKREALYEGFNRATGSVIVTVDSDSELHSDALRNLVTPLVRDRRVGAVAGNVRVLNRSEGPIPTMMDVVFTSSFEFIRTTQSEVGAVMCCPGALSAYRRELVDAFKDEWVTQTFLGSPASIGEDRAMTNHVLRLGHEVRFQANAIVVTKVPTRTEQLAKMLLRWARSDVRETLSLFELLLARRRASDLGIWINLVSSAVAMVLAPVAFLAVIAVTAIDPTTLVWLAGALVVTSAFPAVLYAHLRERRHAWWALGYGVYSLLVLSWIQPYALVTPARAKWLTRTLPVARQRT
jgi:hyaluronan synthase